MTTATLLSMIGNSAASARTLSHIAEAARCSRREVEAAVQDARLRGVPLITSQHGVWRAETPQEARDMAARLRTRATHQMATAAALERAAERMDAPLSLWDTAA